MTDVPSLFSLGVAMDRTKVQMDALAASAFADPVHRKFPVVDQGDLDFVVEHYKEAVEPAKVKAQAIKLAEENALNLPDGWKNAKMSGTLLFGEIGSSAVKRSDGWWIRKGKHFECDREFVDMNGNTYALSRDRAAEVIPNFQPTDVNFQHDPSLEPLLNMMFDTRPKIESLELVGKDVIATYAVPDWFQTATGGKAIPTSSEWDMQTDLPKGGAYVVTPAVKDAIMLSEPIVARFKEFDTAERDKLSKTGAAMSDGSFPVTDEKDVKNAVRDWGRAGSKADVKAHIIKRAKALGCEAALPDGWGNASMAALDTEHTDTSVEKLDPTCQKTHDLLCGDGVECGGVSMFSAEELKEWQAARTILMMTPRQLRLKQKLHDMHPKGHCTHYATTRSGYNRYYSEHTPASESTNANKGTKMNLKERLVAYFKGKGVSDEDAELEATVALSESAKVEASATPAAPASFAASAEFKAMQDTINAQTAMFASLNSTIEDLKKANAEVVAKSDEEKALAKFASDSVEIDALSKSGKITPAEAAAYKEMAKEHVAAFASILPSLQARPVLAQFSNLSTKTIKPVSGSPEAQLQALTKERMAQTKETYTACFKAVCEENKELAAASSDAQANRVRSNGVE